MNRVNTFNKTSKSENKNLTRDYQLSAHARPSAKFTIKLK